MIVLNGPDKEIDAVFKSAILKNINISIISQPDKIFLYNFVNEEQSLEWVKLHGRNWTPV